MIQDAGPVALGGPRRIPLAKTEAKEMDIQQSVEIPKKLPLLPIRDIVCFPIWSFRCS